MTTYAPGDTVIVTADTIYQHGIPAGSPAVIIEDDAEGLARMGRIYGLSVLRVSARVSGTPVDRFVSADDIEPDPASDVRLTRCPCGCGLPFVLASASESSPEPDPAGAIVYVTGDTDGSMHHFPVGTEVEVLGFDPESLDNVTLMVARTDDPDDIQYLVEADVDLTPPDTGPFMVGEQVRTLGLDETYYIAEHHRVDPRETGGHEHFYTVVSEDFTFADGCSTRPGCGTYPASFLSATDAAPLPPSVVDVLVRLAERRATNAR